MKIHKVEFKFEYSLRFKQKENGMKKKREKKIKTSPGLAYQVLAHRGNHPRGPGILLSTVH
jgi:hypothetical protein